MKNLIQGKGSFEGMLFSGNVSNKAEPVRHNHSGVGPGNAFNRNNPIVVPPHPDSALCTFKW